MPKLMDSSWSSFLFSFSFRLFISQTHRHKHDFLLDFAVFGYCYASMILVFVQFSSVLFYSVLFCTVSLPQFVRDRKTKNHHTQIDVDVNVDNSHGYANVVRFRNSASFCNVTIKPGGRSILF